MCFLVNDCFNCVLDVANFESEDSVRNGRVVDDTSEGMVPCSSSGALSGKVATG